MYIKGTACLASAQYIAALFWQATAWHVLCDVWCVAWAVGVQPRRQWLLVAGQRCVGCRVRTGAHASKGSRQAAVHGEVVVGVVECHAIAWPATGVDGFAHSHGLLKQCCLLLCCKDVAGGGASPGCCLDLWMGWACSRVSNVYRTSLSDGSTILGCLLGLLPCWGLCKAGHTIGNNTPHRSPWCLMG